MQIRSAEISEKIKNFFCDSLFFFLFILVSIEKYRAHMCSFTIFLLKRHAINRSCINGMESIPTEALIARDGFIMENKMIHQ